MLILHSAPQLNPLSGYLEQSTEFLWSNRALVPARNWKIIVLIIYNNNPFLYP